MWKDVGVLFCVSFVFFSVVFLVPDKNIFLSNYIGDFLGKISYSLYLLQYPVIWQLENQAKEKPEIFLIIFLIVLIVISYISYLIIECPTRRTIRTIMGRIG
jgi:peptidoglycan/LPS O-acetylase OafA/YrhL